MKKYADMKQKKESTITKKQQASENYFKTEKTSDEIDWNSILERRCKRGARKLIDTLGAES